MIALRGCHTLVPVHRRQLLDQWRERLKSFLSIDDSDIGVIGGGRRKPTGRIDVALIHSLVRNGEVSDLVADYGHLIVDECHHLSAVSFELVARRARGRFVLACRQRLLARMATTPSSSCNVAQCTTRSTRRCKLQLACSRIGFG
jgi:superfamily II DNA or RNA helicase